MPWELITTTNVSIEANLRFSRYCVELELNRRQPGTPARDNAVSGYIRKMREEGEDDNMQFNNNKTTQEHYPPNSHLLPSKRMRNPKPRNGPG